LILHKALPLRAASPETWAAGLSLAALLLLAWAFLASMVGSRGIVFCGGAIPSLPLFYAMWAVMMVAMMAPSAMPMILAYAQEVVRREPASSRLGLVAVFAGLYFIVWSAFGALAGTAELLLREVRVVENGRLTNAVCAGVLFIVAGLYQWSATKESCLARCHAPATFLDEHYRPGFSGAVRLGMEHSAACIGCCFMLMLLAFVGGSMHLAWMVALTALVALEKIVGARSDVLRLGAAVMIAAGLALILAGPRIAV
jgi:predicted metal-binding membrane protein